MTRHCFALCLLFVACGAPTAPVVSPQRAPEPLRLSFSGVEAEPAGPVARAPTCSEGQLVWRPRLCQFAHCRAGKFVVSKGFSSNCEQPVARNLHFEKNDSELSVERLATLENAALMAERAGAKELVITGHQSWDEKPDKDAKLPLSRQRVEKVRDALAAVTRLPIRVVDGGTHARRFVTGEERERNVQLRTNPFELSEAAEDSEPFVLPWTSCSSEVKLSTDITLYKRDGEVVVELCRNKLCSRQSFSGELQAQWPGGLGAVMQGDFDGNLSLEPNEEQMQRSTPESFGKGEGPASFRLEVSTRDFRIAEKDTFRLRVYRQKKQLGLDWSGQVVLLSTPRHATKPAPPCLRGSREIPQEFHQFR